MYENEDNDSLIAKLERGVDFEYGPDGNFILFAEEQVPPSEYYIVARYDPLPEGARNDGVGGGDE